MVGTPTLTLPLEGEGRVGVRNELYDVNYEKFSLIIDCI